MILKRIGPLSLAKLLAILYASVGLIFGACISIASLIAAGTHPDQSPGLFVGLFGVGAILWLPILYGAMGFIGSLITAGLYNWLARLVGGVHIDLE